MAGQRKELIGPPIIYENPYTGTPVVNSAANPDTEYSLKSSPKVTWGATKKHSILWVESQWNIEGDMQIDPDGKLKAMSVITLRGIGRALSGNWWVSTVTHTIDGNGYSVTANVLRNAYGTDEDDDPAPDTPPGERKDEAPVNQDEPNKYTVKPGDTLWMIAVRFYGNGADFSKIQTANNLDSTSITPGQELTIPQ